MSTTISTLDISFLIAGIASIGAGIFSFLKFNKTRRKLFLALGLLFTIIIPAALLTVWAYGAYMDTMIVYGPGPANYTPGTEVSYGPGPRY